MINIYCFSTCTNSAWDCQPVTPENLKNFPNNTVEETECLEHKNQVYTHCEPSEPLTCQVSEIMYA